MSNALAIAATTATLRNLLLSKVPLLLEGPLNLSVTTSPPDVAGDDLTGLTINLFLYHVVQNAGLRNMDMPRQVRPGESASPPLSLNLQYLLTVYSDDSSDANADSHRALGAAMSVLHDHPLLGAQELHDALAGNDLEHQIERLRISHQPLNLDDMSKLWSAFQTGYRMSVAYEVSVVLIDSLRRGRAPLPVLRRGPQDRGAAVGASAAPSLASVRAPRQQQAARLGETIEISGLHLAATGATLRFSSLALHGLPAREIAVSAGKVAGSLSAVLPTLADDAGLLSHWAPGFYTVELLLRAPGMPAFASNAVAFGIAPALAVAPNVALAGDIISLDCTPRILPSQKVFILFGDRQLLPATLVNPAPGDPDFDTAPTRLTFAVPAGSTGDHVVRLRVDGVDSIPVIFGGAGMLAEFDPAQLVSI